MSNEEYRRAISELVARIHDDAILKRIYTIIHRFFVDGPDC